MAELSERSGPDSWRAVLFIASTYVYFLIFAQFGFLKRLAELHIGAASLTPVMAAMAIGGVFASLLAQRLLRRWAVRTRLHAGFLGCAFAAALSLLPLGALTAGIVAALIGLSLGLLTVTLVAHLRLWTGSHNSLLKVALGTGFGYFLCNVPWLFAGKPLRTAVISAAGCLLAAVLVNEPSQLASTHTIPVKTISATPFWAVLLGFFALIWLDSAAFYIIQNSPALKSGTWQGTRHLWSNGFIHLAAALGSAWLIKRRGLLTTLLAAFFFIGAACLLLHDPARTPLASLLYPAGVSLYSVALVAYPSILLISPSSAAREWHAGLIYAIAGWVGSALGIGMGQHLHRVPTPFIVAAGIAIAASFGWRVLVANKAPAAAILALAVIGFFLQHRVLNPAVSAPLTADTTIARGRQVYIAEGCINCHSQYVRPHDQDDVTMWGPGSDVEAVRREHPPLIGNRRQGPDLSEVGGRRSPLWLRIHFMNPRDVSYHSIMPSYRYLFADDRGDSLIAYMMSLKNPDDAAHLHQVFTSWTPSQKPSKTPGSSARPNDGQKLFSDYCATCHLSNGRARVRWAAAFRQLPPDLFSGPLPYVPATDSAQQQTLQLERIIKFGLPGTDMPGHEYLPDSEVINLTEWLMDMRSSRASSRNQTSTARRLPFTPTGHGQRTGQPTR